MYINIHTYISLNMHICIHKYVYTYNSRAARGKSPGDKECSAETASIHISIYIYIMHILHIHIYVYICIHRYTYINICVYEYIYIHTQINNIYNSRAARGKSPSDKECSTETASKTTSICAISSFCFWSRPQIVGIMFRSVAQLCVAWCCSVLRGVAVRYSVSQLVTALDRRPHVAERCTPVCCMVLQCIAKCCSMLHGVAV